MDMKRILQAFDGASTKPVEGANQMSKFLKLVSEADINQSTSKAASITQAPDGSYTVTYLRAPLSLSGTPEEGKIPPPQTGITDLATAQRIVASIDKEEDVMATMPSSITVNESDPIPAMPDVTGLQPGQSKDLDNGERVTVNKDGTVSYSGGWGVYVYNAQGQHVKTQSPAFGGYSQETDPSGKVIQQNYNAGPMSVQQGPQGTTARYNIGGQEMTTTQVQENDLSKFLSIVDKNDVKILNESSPHKVTLPVQMAMQHYQKPKEKVVKNSLISKYFVEAEEAIKQKEEDRKDLIRQYASVIAERVMIKESSAQQAAIAISKKKSGKYDKDGKRIKEHAIKGHQPGFDGGVGPGMQDYTVDEAPIELDIEKPMSSMVHSHKGANPGSIEYRIMRARNQLKELAKLAESNDPLVWEHISKLFPELQMNIEQVAHGLSELGKEKRKGGVRSKNIPKGLDEVVMPKITAQKPKAIKPKAKTSTCRAGQVQTGVQTKDGKTVPKCSVK